MMNSKVRRVLMLAACAVLLVCMTVGATLAYLTSTTQVVTNTFTVGNVTITLDEAVVDQYGNRATISINEATGEETRTPDANSTDRGNNNQYKLIPGHSYLKDPTVHVQANSEDCYVRMIVTVSNADVVKLGAAFPTFINEDGRFNLAALVGGWNNATWAFVGCTDIADAVEYEFRYTAKVPSATTVQDLPALFTSVEIPEEINNTDLAKVAGVEIKIVAHAIQADGFADAAAAWAAWE